MDADDIEYAFSNISVYAAQFVAVLRNPFVENEHVKAVLGSHVIALHRRCMAIKLAFAKHAHQTGKITFFI